MDFNWKTTPEDRVLIERIVERASRALGALGHRRDRKDVEMDIIACHNHAFRLRLADWLAADDFNFLHDLFGIIDHLDRETGKISDCFLPRFTERSVE